MSMMPGVTHLPRPSITVAPAGAATVWPTETDLALGNSTEPFSILRLRRHRW
jgi:hypothetical protein